MKKKSKEMKILNQSQNLRNGIKSRSQRWVVAVVLESFPSGAFTLFDFMVKRAWILCL